MMPVIEMGITGIMNFISKSVSEQSVFPMAMPEKRRPAEDSVLRPMPSAEQIKDRQRQNWHG